MEEKKEITIKFTTLLIIILILVIIGLVAYIIYNPKIKEVSIKNVENEVLENNVKDTESNIVKENETVEQSMNISNEVVKEENEQKEEIIDNNISEKEEFSSLKGEKFIQFDNEFYDLKDVAKDYRLSENIKNYKDFNYDLDGDGITDTVTIQKNKDSNENSYIFKLNGKEFAEHWSMPEIYIVDLNEKDGKIEVVVFDWGPSDDPNYSIYSKKGSKMVKTRGVSGMHLKTDREGTIIFADEYNGRTSPELYFYYYYINNKVERKTIDISKIKDTNINSSSLYFTENYNNLDKFWKYYDGKNFIDALGEATIERLDYRTTFKVEKFEEIKTESGTSEYRIKAKLSDGRKGYIFYIQMAG